MVMVLMMSFIQKPLGDLGGEPAVIVIK